MHVKLTRLAKELKFLERLKLKLKGYVYLYEDEKDGWKQPIPIFLIECPVHGLIESYPQGFDNRLSCPLCVKEKPLDIAVKNS